MNLLLKRVYDPPADTDGARILVDRLWPRGLSKEESGIDYWAKDIAPSNELRRWYQHDEEKWPEFRLRYLNELKNNRAAVEDLMGKLGKDTATLLYSSKETHLNNAVVLKQYLETLL
ncbi:MAG: DUF488 domain-containing protein [Methylosarcina sp.]